MNVRELVGQRVLVTHKGTYGWSGKGVEEVKFIEVSPGGGWVKLMNLSGHKYWRPTTDVSVAEVLKDLTAAREKKPE